MSQRRQYPFHLIEPKWQKVWNESQSFRAFNPNEEIPANHPFAQRHKLFGKVSAAQLPPKFYILDMFPYPSGAGLHVGHPEGYTATDILARYKRAQGFNVLHPMGWDAFGLPAEQYAVKTGQHPRQTTEENIATFKRQIQSLGFSYDWSRELATTDPDYFQWTQWIFLKLYNSWFNPEKINSDGTKGGAEPIEFLRPIVEEIVENVKVNNSQNTKPPFRYELILEADELLEKGISSDDAVRKLINDRRLAYVAKAEFWWCEELGTVLANEEVIDGKSEVGGFPVVKKPMLQWILRITDYAERLSNDLDTIDWSDSLKEMQRNWIGRSEGAEVKFRVEEVGGQKLRIAFRIEVFTTRPDTLFGATYMVLAPENELVDSIVPNCWPDNSPTAWRGEDLRPGGFARPIDAVEFYRVKTRAKSDLERTLNDKSKIKTGVFTGAYAVNPANDEKIPIWIADYVLANYGTGAIMAVPAHDERDFEFATKYNLPIREVIARIPEEWINTTIAGTYTDAGKQISPSKIGHTKVSDPRIFWNGQLPFVYEGVNINSQFLNGLKTEKAKEAMIVKLKKDVAGFAKTNYKLRDWLFSRQRYWGEPFPIVWKIATTIDSSGTTLDPYHEALPESALPILPPILNDYKPMPGGEPPLARAKKWVKEIPPDFAKGEFSVLRETNTMPQWAGSCWYYLRYLDAKNNSAFVGKDVENYWMGGGVKSLNGEIVKSETNSTIQQFNNSTSTPGVDLYVGGTEHAVLHLLYARFWHKVLFDLGHVSTPEPFFKLVNQGIILGEDGQKMSKSRGNVVNPDDVLGEYGADAFRLYEMFMGPLEMVKPWNTKGVEGVYRFLGRVWRLFVDEKSETAFEQAETVATEAQRHGELLDLILLDAAIAELDATPAQLKALHACIKKVTEDLDGMRFNTAISAMMVFINEAMTWQTKPLSVMKTFLQLLAPFAPHLAEELWARLHATFGQTAPSLAYASWPKFDAALLVENEIEIPVQVNGKLRDVIKVSVNATQADLETAAKNSEKVKPVIEGKTIKKTIVVPKKMVNLIVG